jgi:hypothetical protein
MLYDALFLVLAILYFAASIQIDNWTTISILGFRSETPLFFIQKPGFYNFIRSAVFLGAAATLFIVSALPWYMGAGFLAFLWFYAGTLGRKKAFAKYREIMGEMLEFAETDEEKSQYIVELQKTDQELMDETLK